MKLKREKEEEERIKALPPREREDVKKRRERLSGMLFLFFSYTFHPERLLDYESSSRDSVLDEGRRTENVGSGTRHDTRSCASASAKRQDDNYSKLPKSHWTTRAITKKELPKSIYRNTRVKNVKKRGGGRKMRKRGGDRGCWLMRVIRYPAGMRVGGTLGRGCWVR